VNVVNGTTSKNLTGVRRGGRFTNLSSFLKLDVGSAVDLDGWFDLRRNLFDDRIRNSHMRSFLEYDQIEESLDNMVQNNQIYILDHWVENYLKSGASPGQVVNMICGRVTRRPCRNTVS
jgi:hypothetical protein